MTTATTEIPMGSRHACLTPLLAALLAGCSSSAATTPDAGSGRAPVDGGTSHTSRSSRSSGAGASSSSGGATHHDGGAPGTADATSDGGGTPSGPTVAGCPMFPATYAYNQDISQASVDVGSAGYLAALKANAPVIGLDYPGGEIYSVVPASQPNVHVQAGSAYGFDTTDTFFFVADAGSSMAPIPAGVQFENQGTPNADHHMMVVQQGTCQLFELYAWNPTSATTGWSVMVTWDLRGANAQIPDNLEVGSTTAAGTPLLPGVIWPDEVAAGEISHAIDIVMPVNAVAKCKYVHPASSGSWTATGGFPYGGRFRLKASYDLTKVTGTQALVVLKSLQKYGMFNTDISGETRSSFRLGGLGSAQGWVESDITQLGNLTWDDFDVIDLGTVMTLNGCQ